MENRILELEKITHSELTKLDKSKCAVFWTISPIEVHGPHLPLGTDVRIGQEVLKRAAKIWIEKNPDNIAVMLPPLWLGADVVPLTGSIQVDGKLLVDIIVQTGKSLAQAGFPILVLGSNHGGPRHLLALEAGSRKVEEKTDMLVVNSFGAVMNALINRDPEILKLTRINPTSDLGGKEDLHAGNFETSLALATFEQDVDPIYKELPATKIQQNNRTAQIIRTAAKTVQQTEPVLKSRAKKGAEGLEYAASLLDWISTKQMPSYIGHPAKADIEIGKKSLQGMAEFTAQLMERALAGENIHEISKPLLWDVRAIALLPL